MFPIIKRCGCERRECDGILKPETCLVKQAYRDFLASEIKRRHNESGQAPLGPRGPIPYSRFDPKRGVHAQMA